jgi:hypothetical protein
MNALRHLGSSLAGGGFSLLLAGIAPFAVADTVPASLKAVEEAAEAVQDATGDAAGLKAAAKAVEAALGAAQKALADAHAPAGVTQALADTIRSLADAASAGDSLAIRRGATEVSLATADAFDVFRPLHPTDLIRLDALAVRVPLEMEAGRAKEAAEHVEHMEKVWDRLKDHTPKAAAATVRETSRQIETLEGAVAGARLEALRQAAGKIADLVDDLEKALPR